MSIVRSLKSKNVLKQSLRLVSSRYYATLYRSHSATSATVDDPTNNKDHLRIIFDDKNAWKFHSKIDSSSRQVGLFENPHFGNIHGIDYATKQAIQRAQIIVERICNAPQNGQEEMTKIVKNLDRLSDTLCSVIDLAEFVRNAHPDPHIMEAANKAYGDLCSYMNTLNTDVRIHKVEGIMS